MVEFLKNRWFLFTVLVVFTIAKIPALSYPFFWDESWSYAPGVKLMYQHGPSLMPNAIDLFYSRGHPLLFYATAASWMHIFGPSQFSQHCFGLTVSLLLLISIYEVCLRVFNQRVAVISVLLVALQVMFFVQSTFVLPEIMIALLSLLTLYFYSAGKHLYTFLCCAALLLTKESGVILGVVLGGHATVQLFRKSILLKERLLSFLSIVCAGVVIGIFFFVQKKVNGWYFFPQHVGLIQLNWEMVKGKMRFALEIIFDHQFRYRQFQLLLLLCIIVAIHLRNFRLVVPVFTAILLYIIVEEDFGYISRKMLYPLLFSMFFYCGYILNCCFEHKTTFGKKFVYLGIGFFLAYLAFSSLNFFTSRYLLCGMVVLFIIAAAWFDLLISSLYSLIYYLSVACILFIAVFAFKFNSDISDSDLGAFPAMEVQADVVNYFERNQLYDKYIGSFSALERDHLTNPNTGFLHSGNPFKNLEYDIYRLTDYVIFDNIEPDERYAHVWKDTTTLHVDFTSMEAMQQIIRHVASGKKLPLMYTSTRGDKYRLVFRTAHDDAWAEVFKRE